MATNNLPEVDKYQKEANEMEACVEAITRFHQMRDQFASLETSLRLERRQLNETIFDSTSPDSLIGQLDKIDKALKLNGASRQALETRIAAREKYLRERLPMTLRAFGTLRDFVSFSALETARGKVRALIAADYQVSDEHVDAVALCCSPYVELSRVKLPSAGWVLTKPLDEKPAVWNSLVRPFTDEEWAAQRAEQVKAIIQAANELLRACGPLLEAARGYGEVPKFVCEPEPPPPPPETHPEWNEPIASDRMRALAAESGRKWEELSPADMKILADAEAENNSYLKQARPWAGVPVAEPEGELT